MSFVIFAWAASFVYGFVNVIGKLTSKYAITNIWLFNFLYGLFTLLFTIPFAVNNHVETPIVWNNLLITVFFYLLFLFFYTLSLFRLDVSVLSPIFNFRTAFSAIFSLLLLGEYLSGQQTVLIIITFIAGIFVSLDEKFSLKSFFRISILYGILMTLFLALYSIFTKKAIADTGYWSVTLYVPLLTQIILLLTIPFFYKELKTLSFKKITGVMFMALAAAIGNIFANKAYETNVSISTVIIALPLSMFIVFVLSLFAPKLLEKHTLKVYALRFLAAFIMIGSALMLSS